MFWPWQVYVFIYSTYRWIYISPHFFLCHNCCCLDLPISPDDVVMVAAILTFQCLWVPRPRAPEKLHSHLRGATLQIRQAINLSTHFRKIMENPWFHHLTHLTSWQAKPSPPIHSPWVFHGFSGELRPFPGPPAGSQDPGAALAGGWTQLVAWATRHEIGVKNICLL